MSEYSDTIGVTIVDAEKAMAADYWEVRDIWIKHRIDWIPVGGSA